MRNTTTKIPMREKRLAKKWNKYLILTGEVMEEMFGEKVNAAYVVCSVHHHNKIYRNVYTEGLFQSYKQAEKFVRTQLALNTYDKVHFYKTDNDEIRMELRFDDGKKYSLPVKFEALKK